MIILDDPPLLKQAPALFGEPSASTSLLVEPLTPPPPPYTRLPTDPLLYPAARKSRVCRRFSQAFAVAVLVLALGVCLVWSALENRRVRHQPSKDPIREGCVFSHSWPETGPLQHRPAAFIQFLFPTHTDLLAFESFGDLSSGEIYVNADPAWEYAQVGLQLVAQHSERTVLDTVYVCQRVSESGGHTIQIFAPSGKDTGTQDPVEFTAALVFPHGVHLSTLYPDVRLNLPNFHTVVRGSGGKMRFGRVAISSEGAPVKVDQLTAERADIFTRNSSIEGTFEIASSLNLTVVDGTITANVDLTSSMDASVSTDLSLSASNGMIASAVRLHSSSWHGQGGNFSVRALGSRAPLQLDVQYVPIDSTVVTNARVTDAPADVRLSPAFEGVMLIESTTRQARFVVRDDVTDPKGIGRERHVEGLNWRQERIAGAVRWGDFRNASYGAVKVVADNGSALLTL